MEGNAVIVTRLKICHSLTLRNSLMKSSTMMMTTRPTTKLATGENPACTCGGLVSGSGPEHRCRRTSSHRRPTMKPRSQTDLRNLRGGCGAEPTATTPCSSASPSWPPPSARPSPLAMSSSQTWRPRGKKSPPPCPCSSPNPHLG